MQGPSCFDIGIDDSMTLYQVDIWQDTEQLVGSIPEHRFFFEGTVFTVSVSMVMIERAQIVCNRIRTSNLAVRSSSPRRGAF